VTTLLGARTDTGEELRLDVDLVLLAMGFTGPERRGLLAELGVELNARGAVATGANHMTSVDGVFAAGDMRRGASLIVWAIREGRDAAARIDCYLASKAATRAVDPDSVAMVARM
jgi:glutamate synthase (NADPH/NADH) small chain